MSKKPVSPEVEALKKEFHAAYKKVKKTTANDLLAKWDLGKWAEELKAKMWRDYEAFLTDNDYDPRTVRKARSLYRKHKDNREGVLAEAEAGEKKARTSKAETEKEKKILALLKEAEALEAGQVSDEQGEAWDTFAKHFSSEAEALKAVLWFSRFIL